MGTYEFPEFDPNVDLPLSAFGTDPDQAAFHPHLDGYVLLVAGPESQTVPVCPASPLIPFRGGGLPAFPQTTAYAGGVKSRTAAPLWSDTS